jgi:hypothetical protein
MQKCSSYKTFFTVGSCCTPGYPAAAPPEYRQSAILQNYPLLAYRQVKLSRSPAGNQHAGLPSQAVLITDQKKRQPSASTLNAQLRPNREDQVISDIHNRLAFLLLICLRQG